MPRTTIDLDASVLRELKARQRREGKTLGGLASELLARALTLESESSAAAPLAWQAQPMGARVDLADTDAVEQVLSGG